MAINQYWACVATILLSAFLGFLIAPSSIRGFLSLIKWIDVRLQKIPTPDFMGGAIGIITGLVISSLFSNSFVGIPYFGPLFSVLLSIFVAYLGMTIGARRTEELLNFLDVFPKLCDDNGKRNEEKQKRGHGTQPGC